MKARTYQKPKPNPTLEANRAADAALFARFLAAAMQHLTDAPEDGTWHYADRANQAAKLAEYMLGEYRNRWPRPALTQVREENAARAARGEPQRVPPLLPALPVVKGEPAKRSERAALRSGLAVAVRRLPENDVVSILLKQWISLRRLELLKAAHARAVGMVDYEPGGSGD